MSPTIRQLCALLCILTLLLAAVPVGAMRVTDFPEPNDQLTEEVCGAGVSTDCADLVTNGPCAEVADDTQSGDQDCCPYNCDDCFLKCCNGPLSLHAFSIAHDAHQPWCSTGREIDDQILLCDGKAVYHPPRS